MSLIYQLSNVSREFCREANIRSAGNLTPISIAVARVVAWKALLPTTEVVDFDSYYRSQVERLINEAVSLLNEDMVQINYRQTMEFAKMFYAARYNMLYGSPITLPSGDISLVQFFGISDVINPELLKLLNEESKTVGRLINGLRLVLREIAELKNGHVD